jgi:hypothetical protein
VRVVHGHGNKLEKLVAFIQKNVAILVQPDLQLSVLQDILENMHLFGFQESKDRGTAQHKLIKSFLEHGGKVADFFAELDVVAAGQGGRVNNAFGNVNGGRLPMERNLDAEQCGDHVDTFTDGPRAKPTTARVICYYMRDGRCATLRIIDDGIVVDIIVPRGCCLYASRELLTTKRHAHGANGRCAPQLGSL